MGGRTGGRPMTVEIHQHRVSCLKCSAHWWIDDSGHEVPGPPFSRCMWRTVQPSRRKIPVPELADTEPTRPCRCAQKHRFIDGLSDLVEHEVAAIRFQKVGLASGRDRELVSAETVEPPPTINLTLRIDQREVGRIHLERGPLIEALVDRATRYNKRLSESRERQERQLAEDRIRGLEARVERDLGDWLADVALWEAPAEAVAPPPAQCGGPESFLVFLESHPVEINLLAVPAVQRALRWIRLECKKPEKERPDESSGSSRSAPSPLGRGDRPILRSPRRQDR